jgi:hypothetical protein
VIGDATCFESGPAIQQEEEKGVRVEKKWKKCKGFVEMAGRLFAEEWRRSTRFKITFGILISKPRRPLPVRLKVRRLVGVFCISA